MVMVNVPLFDLPSQIVNISSEMNIHFPRTLPRSRFLLVPHRYLQKTQ